MNIQIIKNTVYQQALALTAYVGRSIGAYESVAITEDNFPALDTFLGLAVTSAESVLRRHLGASNKLDVKVTDASLELTIDDGLRPNPATRNLAESCIRAALAQHVAGLWLQTTVASEQAKVYIDGAVQQLVVAVSAIVSRDRKVIAEEDYYQASKDSDVIGGDGSSISFASRQEDGVTIGGDGNGSAVYGPHKTDDVAVSPCWKHVQVHVCDDVPE